MQPPLMLESLTQKASNISRDVGKYILSERKQFNPSNFKTKGRNDFLTHVDKTAEEELIRALNKIFPEAGVIAEESGKNEKEKYNWIIDPLDGTTNFIHGIPTFCVSIALQEDDKVILGVVYEINADECFFAWKGRGAFLNGSPISVTSTKELSDAMLATGFPYTNFDFMDAYMKTFSNLVKNSRGMRRLGSAAADMVYVACGRFDGFFEYGLNPWDVAAGALIVNEAGGSVTDFSGKESYIFGGEIIASNSNIHLDMSTIIKNNFVK